MIISVLIAMNRPHYECNKFVTLIVEDEDLRKYAWLLFSTF